MEKYVYSLYDFAHRVKTNTSDWQTSDNITKFTLPDMEPGSNEVSGFSGLNGTIQVSDWSNVGAMEEKLTYSTMPEIKNIFSPEKQFHEFSWMEQYTDKEGNVGWMKFKAYLTVMLKKIPGGDFSKGENGDREFTYGVNAYKLTRVVDAGEAGSTEEVLVDYDPINKKLVLGGNDFGQKLNEMFAGF